MPTAIATPSPGEIAAIIALNANPALRNLKITQCYHDLSRTITLLTGQANVNWCTFAIWASKTAGRSIRNDELSKVLLDLFKQSSNPALAILFAPLNSFAALTPLQDTIDTSSRNIMQGNLKVFAELGPLFAEMARIFAGDTVHDQTKLDFFLTQKLQPGSTESGGQDPLRIAVSCYYQAKFEPDHKKKAELILLANAQTGLHEQIRLQPHIAAALNAPVTEALRAVTADKAILALFPFLGVLEPLVETVAAQWRHFMTRFLMQIPLPDGVLNLGEDLSPLPGQSLFPADLQHITDNSLRTLLARFNALGTSGTGSGATDWADLDERMQFILYLFRSRQQDGRLLEQPFTDAQRADIGAGRMPAGPL